MGRFSRTSKAACLFSSDPRTDSLNLHAKFPVIGSIEGRTVESGSFLRNRRHKQAKDSGGQINS